MLDIRYDFYWLTPNTQHQIPNVEEGGLIQQLGINWQLFLSQAVNFFILLLVLRFFVYKPLLTVIKKRQSKIQEGLQKAEQADIRLKEVDVIAKKHLQKADQQAVEIIKITEEKARGLSEALKKKAQDHQKELMQQAQVQYKRQQEETKNLVFKEALELVKKTIIKTVELNPQHIDEALIKKAALQIKEEK